MWIAGRTAKKVLKQPGTFALAVVKQFRANQGVLLAGAVAYYTLLSLVPLLILILMALSHVISEDSEAVSCQPVRWQCFPAS
jgi:membrane protein